MIKLFGWEEKAYTRLSEKREEELSWVYKMNLVRLLSSHLKYVSLNCCTIYTRSQLIFFVQHEYIAHVHDNNFRILCAHLTFRRDCASFNLFRHSRRSS